MKRILKEINEWRYNEIIFFNHTYKLCKHSIPKAIPIQYILRRVDISSQKEKKNRITNWYAKSYDCPQSSKAVFKTNFVPFPPKRHQAFAPLPPKTHTYTHAQSFLLSHTHTHTHNLSCSLSHTHTDTIALALSHAHAHSALRFRIYLDVYLWLVTF